ncbi:uncharacterized protein LOC123220022 isoform X2 [Mangifera indica]|uniref:uncharacterized protein LOC123220022 isoform X2 n=1 Tax=Mangifera indica TaxID=29780 RepID=UPI001CF97155|nr:uncharacterized protein LOC123220022 isoform X2 [Mangifera indica]
MASCFAPVSISGGSYLRPCEFSSAKSVTFGKTPRLIIQRKSNQVKTSQRFSVCAQYQDGNRGGGGDFVAGFLLGGAMFGTLAYIFAPQIRRSLLNEDEYGFRKAKRPIYYDEGLETLNAKLNQLNSAIDNVSSRLRGKKSSPVAMESDSEVEEATM